MRRFVLVDPELPHQIVIFMHGNQQIAVSCNCLRTSYSHEPIESRTRWDWPDMRAAYDGWHAGK